MNIVIRKILRFLGVKRKRTLGDIDKNSLKEVDTILSINPAIPNIDKIINSAREMICSKCGGELTKVYPNIILDNKFLSECNICKEREYKSE